MLFSRIRNESIPGEIQLGLQIGDDYGETANTAGSIGVGGMVSGSIETAFDEDWFAITLRAGDVVEINLTGVSLNDPTLTLLNASGAVLDQNNDNGDALDSRLVIEAAYSGTYYIVAGAVQVGTGSYQLSVTGETGDSGLGGPGGSTGGFDPLDSIDWGTRLHDREVAVYFGPAGYRLDGYTGEGFNAYEIRQFEAAFDAIEAVTNLRFRTVSSPGAADMRLLMDENEVFGAFLGYFYPPGEVDAGIGVFNGALMDDGPGGDMERGGHSFATILHELLHGLGLAHPHDDGGRSSIMPGVSSEFDDFGTHDLNQGVFTAMTYNSGYLTGGSRQRPDENGWNWGYEATPMALDIALLQEKYGANTRTATGDDVYVLPAANRSGTMWQSIWDAGGNDVIRHDANTAAVIDLRPATLRGEDGGGGFISAALTVAGGFTIANGVEIEMAIGGGAGDRLIAHDLGAVLSGRGGADTLTGGAGDDMLDGGVGPDLLEGGAGLDTADYLSSAAAVFVDMINSAGNSGDAAGDRFVAIEGLRGSLRGDDLRGDNSDNLINGSNGNDFVMGRDGQDILIGGNGNDTLVGMDGNDVLNGAGDDDRLIGGAGNDRLLGMDGDDVLIGTAGNNSMIGGAGNDTMFDGRGDSTLFGGTGADRLIGGAGNDRLLGSFGNDRLSGGNGNDRLSGGEGNDFVVGGAGVDIFAFQVGMGFDVIEDFTVGEDRLFVDAALTGGLSDAAMVLQVFGSVDPTGVELNFGGSNGLLLNGISELEFVIDDLMIV